MNRLRIRAASPADLRAVDRLERASFQDPWSLESLLGELNPGSMRLPLVAEIDGQVCGYIMAWRVADELHILNIAADPAQRRLGIGTALLLAAARSAAAGGQTALTLEVRESNTGARAFYRRHGFRKTGLRRGYYQDNGEDAVVMAAAVETVLEG